MKSEWPPEVRQFLQASYYKSAAHNALLFQELERILAAFEAAQIPVIVLKGAALAQIIYPDPGLRPMNDIDLLVKRDNVKKTAEVLSSIEYSDFRVERISGFNELFAYDTKMLGGPDKRIGVEVHWTLVAGEADARSPSIDWFWEKRTHYKTINAQSTFAGITSISPTAELLYASAHLMLQHPLSTRRLVWFYDLDLLLRKWSDHIDWEALFQQAADFCWGSALQSALQSTQRYFNTPIKLEGLSYSINNTEIDRALERNQLIEQTRTIETWNMFSMLTGRDRVRFALGIFFPSPAYLKERYHPNPKWLWPLYYPYRWFDILSDNIRTLSRR
jgi:hypothetical protein